MLEPGVDAGGLLKEFITILSKKMLDPEQGYFKELSNKTLVVNPAFRNQ